MHRNPAPPALATRLRMELDRLLEREPWREALNLLEQWQALPLLDPALQRDPQRTRRLRWGQRLGLPLMPLLLAGASDPLALARRLQIPGQQQQWLAQMLDLGCWLAEQAPPPEAPPSTWTISLEQNGWSPEAVALLVAQQPRSGGRCCGGGALAPCSLIARERMAAGWKPGQHSGRSQRRRHALLDQSR